MEKTNVSNKKEVTAERIFLDLVFSWSLSDVLNNKLYKNQVRNFLRLWNLIQVIC